MRWCAGALVRWCAGAGGGDGCDQSFCQGIFEHSDH